MSREARIEQVFPIQCKGRDSMGNEVLAQAVDVRVTISQYKGDQKMISSVVECIYNTGGHGQRCKASHPDQDKAGQGVGCPYSFDIPYALEVYNRF